MEIRIGKGARVCRATERPFEHGQQVVSLVRLENGMLVREDYGRDAWNDDFALGTLAVWTTEYIDPAVAEQQPAEVFSPLRQAFYEAAESEGRLELAKAYLAAQLLRRQKVFRLLKESDATDGEVKVILFSDRIGDRLIEVRDPSLTYTELEEGRKALLERLRQLEQPEEPAEPTSQEVTTEQDAQE